MKPYQIPEHHKATMEALEQGKKMVMYKGRYKTHQEHQRLVNSIRSAMIDALKDNSNAKA